LCAGLQAAPSLVQLLQKGLFQASLPEGQLL
jgi:hypothetical protein